jgi:hypothetical protein
MALGLDNGGSKMRFLDHHRKIEKAVFGSHTSESEFAVLRVIKKEASVN